MCERQTLVRQCSWKKAHWGCRDNYDTLSLKDSHHEAFVPWPHRILCVCSSEAEIQEHWSRVKPWGNLKGTSPIPYIVAFMVSKAEEDGEIWWFETEAPSFSALVGTYVFHSFPMCCLLVYSLTLSTFYLLPFETSNTHTKKWSFIHLLVHPREILSTILSLNTKWTYSSHIFVITPQMPWPWTISVRIGLRRGVGSLWSKSEFQGSGPNHHTSFLFWVTFHLSSCLSLLCYFLWSTDLSET